MKRLFGWALVRLYEEGSIVLWDGPMHSLPIPLSGPESSLWSAAGTSTVFSASSISSSMSLFSSAVTDPSTHQDATNGYLSDPQPNMGEPTAKAIMVYLHRTDTRWARVGVWAVEEAVEVLHH